MDSTAQDLEDTLRKMVAVADLLKAARVELQSHIQAGAGANTPIPQSVWAKLHSALSQYNDVVCTIARVGNRLEVAAAAPTFGDLVARKLSDAESGPTANGVVEPSRLPEPGFVWRTLYKMAEQSVALGPDIIEVRANGKSFTGTVIVAGGGRVVQSVGRGSAVIHVAARLNREITDGEAVCIVYHGDRGQVVELLRSQHREPPLD